MYPVAYEHHDTGFDLPFSDIATRLERALPTFDKSLDSYFDKRFAAIIEEWGLLTESDLRILEGRLSSVTSEIDILVSQKAKLEKRIANLDELVSSLETSL